MIKVLFLFQMMLISTAKAEENIVSLPESSLVTPSQAQCSDVDVSSKTGPVYDQHEGGSCYAYAAASAINFDLNGTSQVPISAEYLASVYGDGEDEMFRKKNTSDDMGKISGFNGGHFKKAMAYADEGICSNSTLESVDVHRGKYMKVDPKYGNEEASDYQRILDYYLDLKLKLDGKAPPDQCNQYYSDLFNAVKLVMPNITEKQLQDEIATKVTEVKGNRIESRMADASDFYVGLITDYCEPKAIDVKKTFGARTQESQTYDDCSGGMCQNRNKLAHSFQMLQKQLDAKKPVGIGYSTKGLGLSNDPETNLKHALHESLITGRHWVQTKEGGFCAYKVKNSWGKNWKPTGTGRSWADDQAPGYFWISDWDLEKNLTVVGTLGGT